MSTDLSTILQAYGALVPVSGFSWPSSSSPSAVQEYLIDHVLLNKHLQSYPPSSAYQRAFWKWAIKMLENSDEARSLASHRQIKSLTPFYLRRNLTSGAWLTRRSMKEYTSTI